MPISIQCFGTSIWDETLYKAWSSILHALIPNIQSLSKSLNTFAKCCEAYEVVMFERATFLVVAEGTGDPDRVEKNEDKNRFEKMSNIIKQFRLSCRYHLQKRVLRKG